MTLLVMQELLRHKTAYAKLKRPPRRYGTTAMLVCRALMMKSICNWTGMLMLQLTARR